MAKYELNDYERDIVEGVLAMAQRIVDLQYDAETEKEMQAVLLECAKLFDIETHEMIITEKEDGTITVTALSDEQTKKMNDNPLGWTPRIISNDEDPDEPESD